MDANAWVERKITLDAAEEALLKLLRDAKDIPEEMSKSWRSFYPAGEDRRSNHRRADRDERRFDADAWPTGNEIRDALIKCHEAYDALKECFEQLPETIKKALDIPTMPLPKGEGF